MDRFNSEIIHRIVEHLPPGHPANWDWLLATSVLKNAPEERWYISRQWRDVIERRIFSSVHLESVEESLSEFESAFTHPRRREYLRQLQLFLWLAADSVTLEGHEKNVAVFGNTLFRMFATMHAWGPSPGIRLELSFGRGQRQPLFLGHVFRYLRLTNHELPTVQSITDLDWPAMDSGYMPRLHPTALCQILTALPNLESLTLNLKQPSRRVCCLRKKHRLALADGLRALSLPRLRTLCLALGDDDPKNQSFVPCKLENAQDSPGQIEPLSDALRIFTQSCPLLKEVVLSDGKFSSALFRNPRTAANDTQTWPALESLTITMRGNLLAPNGAWYFTGEEQQPRKEVTPHNKGFKFTNCDAPWWLCIVRHFSGVTSDLDDGESDLGLTLHEPLAELNKFVGDAPLNEWRTRPDPIVFDPLAQSMMEAVNDSMPKLCSLKFEIASNHDPVPSAGVRIACHDTGASSKMTPYVEEKGETRGEREKEMVVETSEEGPRRCLIWLGHNTRWEMPGGVAASCKAWVGEKGTVLLQEWQDLVQL